MESLTALVKDDPYLRMTPQERLDAIRLRKQRFFGRKPRSAPIISVGYMPELPQSEPEPSPEALGSPLNPRMTFDRFMAGKSNAIAHAAALQVASLEPSDTLAYSPLFIFGDPGLGKSHLIQAMAHENPGAIYLTADRFMNEFTAAMRAHEARTWRESLRDAPVLLVDDIQVLGNRAYSGEFSLMLRTLLDHGQKIAVTSDRPPAELEMDERTRARLAGGLVSEIGRLGLGERRGIVGNAAPQLPAPVLDYLAESTISRSGHAIVGLANSLIAHARLCDDPVDVTMAERVLNSILSPLEPRKVRIEQIQRAVARRFNLTRADLMCSRRTHNIVRPRQIAMYLAKTMTLRSLPEIGRRFGGRDHTTVLHAVRKIAALAERDEMLAADLHGLKLAIEEA